MIEEFFVGFLLALIAAAAWAGLDVTRKKLGRHMTATGAVIGLMWLHVLFLNPVLMTGSTTDPHTGDVLGRLLVGYPELEWIYFAPTVASILLNLAANLLFLRAVQISPLGLTTPYLAFTPVFTAVVALIFLGEVPTTAGWLGIGVVCVGAFSLNPGKKSDGLLAPLKALWKERGSLYMLVVALLWSITPALDKTATEMTNPIWHAMFLALGVAVTFTLFRGIRDDSPSVLWDELSAIPGWLALGGGFATVAMVFQLTAYEFIDVAYVETVKRAIGVMAAVLAGYFVFGEGELWRRLVAAGVMSVGVGLILMAGGTGL